MAAPSSPLLLVDRYVIRHLMGWYAGVIAVIVFLLSLETIPGLLDELGGARDRASPVAQSLASLIPEYIAVAIPIALFLSTAITFRRLALAGELEVFAASGLGNRRLLRGPILLGLLSCILLIGLRGYLQPAGERKLDAIGLSAKSGEFGYALEAGASHLLAPETRLYFARVDARSDTLENVVLDRGRLVATAASATLRLAAGDRLVVSLGDGELVWWTEAGRPRVLRFDRFRLLVPIPHPQQGRMRPPRDRLDRFDLDQLLGFADEAQARDLTSAMAMASASARLAAALLCCVLPLYGFAHGVPPKRSRSAIGIGVGIVEIIVFWRISALIEDRFTAIAPAAHAGLIAVFAIGGLRLARFQQQKGFGAVEQALKHRAEKWVGVFRSRPGPAVRTALASPDRFRPSPGRCPADNPGNLQHRVEECPKRV